MVAIARPRHRLVRAGIRRGAGAARFLCGRRCGAGMIARHIKHRSSGLWLAAMIHRLSGLALAIFLPFHFLVLGLAIHGGASLDVFLRWPDQPPVKLAEAGLVFLLSVHLLGGLRVLVIENFPWHDG